MRNGFIHALRAASYIAIPIAVYLLIGFVLDLQSVVGISKQIDPTPYLLSVGGAIFLCITPSTLIILFIRPGNHADNTSASNQTKGLSLYQELKVIGFLALIGILLFVLSGFLVAALVPGG